MAFLLLNAWFYWYYSNSQISYRADSGASSGVLNPLTQYLAPKHLGTGNEMSKQELANELLPLVGEHIEVRDGKVYELL